MVVDLAAATGSQRLEAPVGDIGEEQPEIEVMPVRQPREVPAEPAPAEPATPTPARGPEKVPA